MSSLSYSPFSRIATLMVAMSIFAGCGHEPVRRTATKTSVGEEAATVAMGQIGVPYRYGGSTVRGFDCSGLVQYAWSRAGTSIPRTTSGQWQSLTPISAERIRAGDILFFRIDGKVSHVGLYLGDRRFVHAPSSGREVSIAHLDSSFYRRAFVRAGRP